MTMFSPAAGLPLMATKLVLSLTLLLSAACQEHAVEPLQQISGLRVNAVLGDDGQQGFLLAEQPRTFVFPQDHGAHSGYRSEWWYLTAVLQDAKGNYYGVQFTLFRQALAPQPVGDGPWQTGLVYLAHLALSDVARKRHFQAQRLVRGHPQLASVSVMPSFTAFIEDWSLQAKQPSLGALQLQAQDDGWGLSLEMTQTQAIVLQGLNGLSHKGEGSASYYYSLPRLRTQGVVRRGAQEVRVTGWAWFDREWSTSVLADHLKGWDWMALNLDDGRNIMAFRLRRRDGRRDEYDHGLLVQSASVAPAVAQKPVIGKTDHGVTLLTPQDFELTPQRYWQDANRVAWPVQWTLQLGEETFVIEAMMDDQLMQQTLTYWEGIVVVRNNESQNVGSGYLELTGYGAGDKDD